jgi:hypothetical protein
MIVSTDCLVEMVQFDKGEGNYLVLFESYLNADFTCDIGFIFVRTKSREGSENWKGQR